MPTALKILRGRKRINRREPRPVPGRPAMPRDLGPLERQAWRETIRLLESCPGLLTRADRAVVELIARTLPAWRAAMAHVREHGGVVVARTEKGTVQFVQVSPEMTIAIKLGAALKSLYAELGLTPSGRSRLSVSPAAGPSELDRFLGGKRGA
jgi:P27 family predicted phage terminase small subunit